jgi:hypothetical protein
MRPGVGYSREQKWVAALHQRVMREKIFKTTFFSTALIATAGWVWLLYAGVRWITAI